MILGASSFAIADQALASSVVPNIAPSSGIPYKLATDPVGYREIEGWARVEPVVIILG